ncbi:MAG: hypothetical protein ACPG5B_07160 [Chitinophagales bacterium]
MRHKNSKKKLQDSFKIPFYGVSNRVPLLKFDDKLGMRTEERSAGSNTRVKLERHLKKYLSGKEVAILTIYFYKITFKLSYAKYEKLKGKNKENNIRNIMTSFQLKVTRVFEENLITETSKYKPLTYEKCKRIVSEVAILMRKDVEAYEKKTGKKVILSSKIDRNIA